MGKAIAIGAALASLVLIFCLCCAVVAQDSKSWWKIETKSTTTEYYLGLYKVCIEDKINETCYRFDEKDMLKFMSRIVGDKAARETELLIPESDESRTVWILSFFFIVTCGIAAILSLFAFTQAVVGKAIFITICIQAVMTFCSLILGVACLAYSVDAKNDIWPSGVKFLALNGHSTGLIDSEGRGYVFQLISCVTMVVPYAIYMILIIPARKLQKDNRSAKKITP